MTSAGSPVNRLTIVLVKAQRELLQRAQVWAVRHKLVRASNDRLETPDAVTIRAASGVSVSAEVPGFSALKMVFLHPQCRVRPKTLGRSLKTAATRRTARAGGYDSSRR